MIVIDDNIHCDLWSMFKTFEDAITELRRWAAIPWDEPPNRAPCDRWRECGREYVVMEVEVSQPPPWKRLRRVAVLKVSAEGVEWVSGFEQAWAAAGGAEPARVE